MDNLAKPSVTARKFVEDKPERFALAMGGVNLLRPIRPCASSAPSSPTCPSRMPL